MGCFSLTSGMVIRMDILLIRPRPHPETIGLQSVMICEPLELMQLAAVLLKSGHRVEIADMILEKRSLETILQSVSPQLVGITGYISHIGVIKAYAARIKAGNPKITVAVGGVHAAVCPGDFRDPNIDLICQSAEELYAHTGSTDPGNVLPDRTLTARYARRYYYLFQQNCALIKTSFGCPYSCNFCFCRLITPYHARPIDDVLNELEAIPQEEVYIVDDDFLFDRERLLEFCEKLAHRGIRKHFLVYGRADFIAANRDVMEKLREAGLTAVIVGLEAAKQEELDRFNKKSNLADHDRAVEILQSLGIECYATVILGIDWDKSDFKRLYRYIKELKLVFVNLQPFTPMPGTQHFGMYQDRLIIPYSEPEKWDMAHLVVRPEKLTVRQYYWEILKLYYKITLPPRQVRYMFRRYGVGTTMKLSHGAGQISLQYLKKILRG